MILYYIRHGDPNYEEDTITELGHYQAEETSKFLAKQNIDLIFSSPLKRARDTAKYVEEKINKKAIILPFANENIACRYFVLHNPLSDKDEWLFFNQTWRVWLNELKDDPKWYKSKYFNEPKFLEGMEYYSKEIDEWLKSIGIHHDPIKNTYSKIDGKEVPEKIALFAHGGFAYAFISYILGIRFPYYASHFSCLNTCGVCEFDFDFNSNVVRLLRYNELHYDHDKAT